MTLEDLLLRVKALGRRGGLELLRYNAINSLDAQRALLIERERVDLAIDGGAHRGQWARAVRAAGYGGPIVSYEPLGEPYAALAAAAAGDGRWDARRTALAERVGEAELRVSGNEVSSSLLNMGARHVALEPESAVVRSERVPLVRLDAELLPPAERVMLKLDVQGAELRALDGATGLAERLAIIELELSFVALYEGAPLAAEVLERMRADGFALGAISTTIVDPDSARLVQADAIFARP